MQQQACGQVVAVSLLTMSDHAVEQDLLSQELLTKV